MANRLLIVHGYSDGRTSFTALGEFLIRRNIYQPENVFYLNYSSMDDEATFQDFADKLDADYRGRFADERLDVICHSTGSLVVPRAARCTAMRSVIVAIMIWASKSCLDSTCLYRLGPRMPSDAAMSAIVVAS